ncbi:hypothetical protein ACIQWN_36970 [Streptomyces vinaceus]|uniref:hypothetical protein n=1 Tax=Streptomyces vinaceus TaxID=1960 RepID=UPI0038200A7E
MHGTAAAAQKAAARELLERTLLAVIWYGTAPLNSTVIEHSFVTTGYLRTYSFPCQFGFFALAAWHDPHHQIFVTGSAVRDSLDEATEHALGEAVMVFDGVWQGKTPRYSTRAAIERHASLRSELHAARSAHVEGRLAGSQQGAASMLQVPTDDIVIYQLIEWDGVQLVRAVSKQMQTASTMRAHTQNLPPDPFT